MQEIIVASNDAGQRLDKFLSRYLNLAPKSFLYKMLRKKNIVLNGKKADGSEKISEADSIKLFLADETIASFRDNDNTAGSTPGVDKKTAGQQTARLSIKNMPDIVYEDKNILIVNKPAGMLSQKAKPTDISANEYIKEYILSKSDGNSLFTPSVCNRLDRNTSGLLTAGKTLNGTQKLSEQFRSHKLEKYYLCAVCGSVKERIKTDAYLYKDEKTNKVTISKIEKPGYSHILTEYIPVSSNGKYSLVKIRLYTGKSHQIRAHMAYLGYPLVGDAKYGSKAVNKECADKYNINSQLLHSFELHLTEPDIRVYAKIPQPMLNFLLKEHVWVHGKQEDLEVLH